jgi:prepilin-type processing-associated H-X9-DG protein
MVVLLALLMLTTIGASRPNVPTYGCMNNLRQLATAWRMYSDENTGVIVYNHDGGSSGLFAGDACWVGGWLDFSANTANTNVGLLIDHSHNPYGAFLGTYVKTPTVFKCPSDKSVVIISGQQLPRARSVSMNNCTGSGSRLWTSPSRFNLYTRVSQINSPANIYVFLDERADSINDGCFLSDPDTRYQIIDFPASYHDGAANFSFVDGHVEVHKWKDPRTMPLLQPGGSMPLNLNLPGDVDADWIAQHASEPK